MFIEKLQLLPNRITSATYGIEWYKYIDHTIDQLK